MEFWTTFTPQKVCWELTYIQTKGRLPSSDWQKHIKLIDDSLKKLKYAGISGIRLVIYPSEVTNNGKTFRWGAIDKILSLVRKRKLEVDLCVGPFQYPNYPGIYLPEGMLQFVFDNKRCLDTTSQIWEYGMNFLKEQITRFGNDRRIHGFHLANEWPDVQRVKGREKIKSCVSEAFMLECARYIKENTKKSVFMNTNIEASDKKKLIKTFGEILEIFSNRLRIGFDIYPTQMTWRKNPITKLLYIIRPYYTFFKSSKKALKRCELYFAEFEAQPWGNGKSWYQIINESAKPQEKILNYSVGSLDKTQQKYIYSTGCKIVSLWGSDFWLAADSMGIRWPLAQVKSFSSRS